MTPIGNTDQLWPTACERCRRPLTWSRGELSCAHWCCPVWQVPVNRDVSATQPLSDPFDPA